MALGETENYYEDNSLIVFVPNASGVNKRSSPRAFCCQASRSDNVRTTVLRTLKYFITVGQCRLMTTLVMI